MALFQNDDMPNPARHVWAEGAAVGSSANVPPALGLRTSSIPFRVGDRAKGLSHKISESQSFNAAGRAQ